MMAMTAADVYGFRSKLTAASGSLWNLEGQMDNFSSGFNFKIVFQLNDSI